MKNLNGAPFMESGAPSFSTSGGASRYITVRSGPAMGRQRPTHDCGCAFTYRVTPHAQADSEICRVATARSTIPFLPYTPASRSSKPRRARGAVQFRHRWTGMHRKHAACVESSRRFTGHAVSRALPMTAAALTKRVARLSRELAAAIDAMCTARTREAKAERQRAPQKRANGARH